MDSPGVKDVITMAKYREELLAEARAQEEAEHAVEVAEHEAEVKAEQDEIIAKEEKKSSLIQSSFPHYISMFHRYNRIREGFRHNSLTFKGMPVFLGKRAMKALIDFLEANPVTLIILINPS